MNEPNQETEPITQDDTIETDDVAKEAFRIRDKLRPWNKQIMITLSIILIMLVVFMGFAMGGEVVCRDLEGLLDSKFKCHPGFYNQTDIDDFTQQQIEQYGRPVEDLYKIDIANGTG